MKAQHRHPARRRRRPRSHRRGSRRAADAVAAHYDARVPLRRTADRRRRDRRHRRAACQPPRWQPARPPMRCCSAPWAARSGRTRTRRCVPSRACWRLRAALGVYANLRPLQVHPALAALSPLKNEKLKNVDVLFVRELTGGAYFGAKTRTADAATDECKYTVAEIERVVRRAFELARGRRQHVTSVDKANVLETSRLWRSTVQRIAADYPDVKVEHQLVDSMAMLLLTQPSRYDVVVTENLFGDILTDEAAALAGSLGLLPSASLGEGQGRPVRTHPRLGTGYRRPGRGQSDRHDPVRGACCCVIRWSWNRKRVASRSGRRPRCCEHGPHTRDIGGQAPAPKGAGSRACRTRRTGRPRRRLPALGRAHADEPIRAMQAILSSPLRHTEVRIAAMARLSSHRTQALSQNRGHMRSDLIKTGPDRAPARAMLRATGLDDDGHRQATGGGGAHLVQRQPVQPQPARAGRTRRRRHSRGRRHAGGVQHHRGHRRHRHGHARHARLADQPRSDHRFDRARGRRPLS